MTSLDDPALVRIAKALADPTRARILEAIVRDTGLCCGDVGRRLPVTQATVSHPLPRPTPPRRRGGRIPPRPAAPAASRRSTPGTRDRAMAASRDGQPPMTFPIGTRIGPYEIRAPRGAGRRGEGDRAAD